jgi:hypothetical protein
MNNTINKIEGIGRITNTFNPEIYEKHSFKIYNDCNYSRYVYYGTNRIDKTEFTKQLKYICLFLEHFVFYGYGPLDKPKRGTHMKRGMGINRLPITILKKYHNKILNLDKQIKYFFDIYDLQNT